MNHKNHSSDKGYKQTEVGVIPEDWRICDISDLCSFQRGFDITEATRVVGDVPVYSSSGLSYFHSEAKLNPPSVVTGRKGILGKVFYIEEPCWPHDTTLWVKDFKGNDPKFVYWYLIHFKLERFDAATSVPTLNRNNLVGVPIPLPPTKAEQTAIAAALSDADALITSLEKLIAKKRNIKQGAMQKCLNQDSYDLDDDHDFGEAKENHNNQTNHKNHSSDKWVVKRLGEIAEVGRGRVISHKDFEASIQSKYPVYSSQTSNNGIMGYIDTYDFDGEYVTWTTDGVNAGTVFYRNGKFNCTNVCGTIKLKKDNAKFVAMLLDTITPKYVSRNLANPKLMNDPMKKIEISLPSIAEQTRIAAILCDMDPEIEALEKKLEKYRRIKQGMMQELLTGKTRLIESTPPSP